MQNVSLTPSLKAALQKVSYIFPIGKSKITITLQKQEDGSIKILGDVVSAMKNPLPHGDLPPTIREIGIVHKHESEARVEVVIAEGPEVYRWIDKTVIGENMTNNNEQDEFEKELEERICSTKSKMATTQFGDGRLYGLEVAYDNSLTIYRAFKAKQEARHKLIKAYHEAGKENNA